MDGDALVLEAGLAWDLRFRGAGGGFSQLFGGYVSVLGDPFPSLVGGNVAFNLTDFLRLNAGYGSVTASVSSTSAPGSSTNLSVTTIGGGGKLFVPGWNFSPMVGFNWSQVTVSTSGPSSTNGLYGFTASGSTTYVTLGFDWQAMNGFDFAFGYNESLTAGVGGLGFGQIGWFF